MLLTFFDDCRIRDWRMILTWKGVTVYVGSTYTVVTGNFSWTARIVFPGVIVNEWVRFGTMRFFWIDHSNEVFSEMREMLENQIPWDIMGDNSYSWEYNDFNSHGSRLRN